MHKSSLSTLFHAILFTLIALPLSAHGECIGFAALPSNRGVFTNFTSDLTQKVLYIEPSQDGSRRIAEFNFIEANQTQSRKFFTLLRNTNNEAYFETWLWNPNSKSFVTVRRYDSLTNTYYDDPISTPLLYYFHEWVSTVNANFEVVFLENRSTEEGHRFKLFAVMEYDLSGNLINIDQQCVEELPYASDITRYDEETFGLTIGQSPEASSGLQAHVLCTEPAGVVATDSYQCLPLPGSGLNAKAKSSVNAAATYLRRALNSKSRTTKIQNIRTAEQRLRKALGFTATTNGKYQKVLSLYNQVRALLSARDKNNSKIRKVLSAAQALLR